MGADDDVRDIDRRLRSVEIDVTALKSQMIDARADLKELKIDVKGLVEAVNQNGDEAKKVGVMVSTSAKLGGLGLTGIGVFLAWAEFFAK